MPARPVTGWTVPSHGAPSDEQPFNPIEAWTTLIESLTAVQRKAWSDVLGATGARRPNDR